MQVVKIVCTTYAPKWCMFKKNTTDKIRRYLNSRYNKIRVNILKEYTTTTLWEIDIETESEGKNGEFNLKMLMDYAEIYEYVEVEKSVCTNIVSKGL